MKQKILVAGGTGNLGGKVIHALLEKDAEVRILVRPSSDAGKLDHFKQLGAEVIQVDMSDAEAVTRACDGIDCVVSTLAGLRDVVVDTQKILLDAAIAAGVPRFIPSDFSLNFTQLPGGENRNFDLRRKFHTYLDKAPISATSIYNGAFAHILTYNIPIFDYKNKVVGYWGDDPTWLIDFTTIDDTAAFTAEAALDPSTPEALNIASFQVSPKDLSDIASLATGAAFNLVNMGSLEKLAAYNKREREAHPEGENELYASWQNGQYMHDMFSVHHELLDNNRYPHLNWTDGKQFIESILKASV